MVGQKKYKTMTVDHNKINEFIMEIGACNLKIYAKDKIAQTKSKNTLKNLEIFSLCLKAIHSQVRNIRYIGILYTYQVRYYLGTVG